MNKNGYTISVITPSYNMGGFIEENILSVFNQTYKNYEHIIIDGGSSDNTVEILKKHTHLKWVSETDSGQSEAYNKGLRMVTGKLVLCLNADDFLLDSNVFQRVVSAIGSSDYSKYSAFMGNILVTDENGLKISEMVNYNRDYSFDDLLNNLPNVIHPGTFFKTDILKSVGGFANDVHYVMDYDIFLRCSKVKPIHSINTYISALRRHENSKAGSEANWKFSYEFLKVRRRFGGNFFHKISLNPIKVLIYKFIIGYKNVERLKKNKIIYSFVNKIGFTKLNSLSWYADDEKNI
jgi:glycosyltransferase involved in cell wall biosynthesis